MMNEAGRQAVNAEQANWKEWNDFKRAAEIAIGRPGDVTVSVQDPDFVAVNSAVVKPEYADLVRKYCREYLPHIHTIGISSKSSNAIPFSALEGIAANLRDWGYDCHFMEFSAEPDGMRSRMNITAAIIRQGTEDSEARRPDITITATPAERQHAERITAKDIMNGIRVAMDSQRRASMPR